ncbi:MAG: c-type cytochrome [Xanthobacteraceae bacterium]
MDVRILQTSSSTRRYWRKSLGVSGLRLTLWTTILTIAFITLARAEGANTAAVSDKEVQAKLAYCEVCHGVSAQGFHGYYPIPRLAGQPTEYLKNQLQAFVERRRTSNIMFNVGHVLSPDMINALTTDFRELNPKPLGGAPTENAVEGKQIFENGISDANVPPCASCHGPEAKGNGPFPRLAGQLYDYVVNKLTNWDKERGQNPASPDTSAMMQPIAHSLTQPQIKAVSAYVSTLE